MEILFRPIEHSFDEEAMGHAIWFQPIGDVDGISATANGEGSTPLTSIARAYGWQRETIRDASDKCNKKDEICILDNVNPKLMLVPKTKGHHSVLFYINDLLLAANHLKLKNLHFTHYRFVQNKLPKDEIYEILSVMMSPLLNSTLEKVIWDIDVRQEDNMETMYQYMRHYGLRLVNEA